eukprot:TRINITY_DN1302_c0_g1_i1.p1 TRINITY_DN1302_c0_g1~~TRINITY_DN1302_c0_g1_i1.p1  ORF type:complete len:509 (-),score=126.97 TRINITY_DN1302_c0_g1_i1:102-1628(-)
MAEKFAGSGFLNYLSDSQKNTLEAFEGKVSEEIVKGEDVTLWGANLKNKNDVETRVVLLKFLRARDFKPEPAFQQLSDTLKWRKEFNVDNILNETFPDQFTSLGFLHKTDKEGRPVMINTYGNINPDAVFGEGIDKFIRWRVQLMEKGMALLNMRDVENMIVIHDYDGVAMSRTDARVKAASKTIIQLFQNYYPETIARKVFVNVPWFFGALYSLFSSFTSERTRSKFIVCTKGAIKEKLIEFIPVDNLPEEYGGFSKTERSKSGQKGTADEKTEEITIESRKTFSVYRTLKPGEMILWEATTKDKDISLALKRERDDQEDEPKESRKVDVVVPLVRNFYHSGNYTSTMGGVYILFFDNSYSMMNKKTVFYKVAVTSVELPSSPSSSSSTTITTTTYTTTTTETSTIPEKHEAIVDANNNNNTTSTTETTTTTHTEPEKPSEATEKKGTEATETAITHIETEKPREEIVAADQTSEVTEKKETETVETIETTEKKETESTETTTEATP